MTRIKPYFKTVYSFLLRQSLFRLRKFINSYSIGQPCGERRASCPVCHESASQLQYKHKEFRHTKVHICAKCGHGYTDRDFTIKSSGLWSTNQERADYYLNEVIPSWVQNPQGKKFLEIGACDFYLLSKLRSLFPGLLLYAYDKYPKGAPPDYVRFTSDLSEITQVDYALMLHALEHIYDLDTFLEELRKCLAMSAVLIIEVPNNSIQKHHEVQTGKHVTGYHFHFFNESSLRKIVSKHNFELLMICSFGQKKWGLSGVNLLGVFRYLGN